MQNDKISPHLKQFIVRYLRSVEEAEVLILLQKDQTRDWTVESVS